MNTPNPFDAPASEPTLSAEEQAEFDRLEAEEASKVVDSDERAEENYPIENGAVRWEDAANEGDTSRQKRPVYDTPWGRRELSATEVQDFASQGVTVTLVDDEPHTSLEAEKAELRKVELRNRAENPTLDR